MKREITGKAVIYTTDGVKIIDAEVKNATCAFSLTKNAKTFTKVSRLSSTATLIFSWGERGDNGFTFPDDK